MTSCRPAFSLPTVYPLLAALAALVLAPTPAPAQDGPGDLLVAPTRVVFEGRQRNAEISLVNLGAEAATYRISFIELRMDELGATREIDPAEAAPGERFAASLLRFSPRQVRLEPRVAQTVRLQLRKPEDTPFRVKLCRGSQLG